MLRLPPAPLLQLYLFRVNSVDVMEDGDSFLLCFYARRKEYTQYQVLYATRQVDNLSCEVVPERWFLVELCL
jgi:hypothetical protein